MLLARRSRALTGHVKAAAAGDPRGIHQARVASRRLREAVPVLATGAPDAKTAKTRKQIRRLTRALGASRELDVTLALLDELALRETLPRLALEHVRAAVVKERDARLEEIGKRLTKVKADRLVRRLASLAGALETTAGEPWRGALATRIVKRSRRLDQAVREAGQIYEAERLHKVRLSLKKLRYTLELAGDTGAASTGRTVRLLKRVQDTLGRLHDLQVLQSYVADVQAQPQPAAVEPADLEVLARALEDECRHLHARYVAMAPNLMDTVGNTRSLVVTQLSVRAARGARTLKMRLSPGGRRQQSRLVRDSVAGHRRRG